MVAWEIRKNMRKLKKLIAILCCVVMVISAIPIAVFADVKTDSTALNSLYAAVGDSDFSPLETWGSKMRACKAEKIENSNVWYGTIDKSAQSLYLRISGTIESAEADVNVYDMTDPENKSGVELTVTKGVGFCDTRVKNEAGKSCYKQLDASENPFTTSLVLKQNTIDFLKAYSGTAVYKIVVTNAENREEYYLVLSVNGLWSDELPQNILLKNAIGENLQEQYQFGKNISNQLGVSGADVVQVLPDEIDSIKIEVEKNEENLPNKAYYQNTSEKFYTADNYMASINGSNWKMCNAGTCSSTLPLKTGYNIIQIVGGTPEKLQTARSYTPYVSCTLLVYREGKDAQVTLSGTDTGIKTLDIYQAAETEGKAKEYKKLLAATAMSADSASNLSIDMYSSSPYVYIRTETQDSDAKVDITSSQGRAKEVDGGYLLKVNHEQDTVIPVTVTPANGDETKAQRYEIQINWTVTECAFKSISVEDNGKLTADYDAKTKIYYLIPEDYSKNVVIKASGADNAEVKAYINRPDATASALDNETISIDPKTVHEVLISVTAQDGTENTYTVVVKREKQTDFSNVESKIQPVLSASINAYKASKGNKMNEQYWDTFAMTSAGESLDGYYVYDVTGHRRVQATDFAAIILELVMIGENPYDFDGYNYVEALLNCKDENTKMYGYYANNIWALYALDAVGIYDADLVKTVANQACSASFDLDMRGWALAAIQNHLDDVNVNVEEKSAFGVEAFKANQNGAGPIKGSFENSYYNNSNGLSHACAIMGLAAAKINLEDADWKSQGASPLDRYYNDGQPVAVPSEQPIIALSGLMTQSNVWIDQQLTVSKVNTLLAEARKCTDDSHYGQKISDGIEALTEALGGKTSGAAIGCGEAYYALYDLVGKVIDGWKPNTFMGTEDEKAEVESVIEKIDAISNAETSEKVEAILAAQDAYEALGSQRTLLSHYVKNADILEEYVAEYANVLAVIEAIDNLPEIATTEAEAAIQQANALYEALTEAEKAGVYNYSKLADLLAQLAQLKDKATAVSEQIDALPAAEQVTMDNEAAIAAARAAYDALSDAEKAAVTNYEKLQAAEQQIGNIKAAAEVTQMIDAIGEITLDNYETKYEQIVTARSAYDNLAEGAKALVTNLDTLKKAEETYQSMDEDVKEVIAAISQLQAPLSKSNAEMEDDELYAIWDEYTYMVVNIRGLADELTKDKQAIVTNMKDLETAEAYMQIIKKYEQANAEKDTDNKIATNNYEQAKTLLGAEDFPKAEQYDSTKTENPKDIAAVANQVAQAKAVADTLTDDQKTELKKALGDGIFDNLEALVKLAETVTGYDDQYKATQDELDKEAEKIKDEAAVKQYFSELTEVYNTYKDKEVSRSDIAIIRQTIKAYDDLTNAQKDIITNAEEATTITAMLDVLNKKDEQVQKDEKAAAEVTEYIKNLPTSLNLDNMEAVRSDLQMIADKYNALNANAQSYVRMLSKVTATNNVLNTMTAEINTFREGKPAVTATATAYNSVTVSWNTYQYAQSYDVYRKTAGGEWTKLGNTTALQYVDQTVAGSTAYSYTVVALSSRWGQSVSSAYDENGAAVTTPVAPQPDNGNTTPDNGNTTPGNNNNNNTSNVSKDYTGFKATSAGYNSIRLSWKKVGGAYGYVIYRSTSKNGGYKAIATIKKGKITSYTNKKLSAGKTYYYKLRPFKTVKNKRQYMSYSAVVSARPVPGRVNFTKATAGTRKAVLRWKKVSGASGYQIYRSTSKNSGYKWVSTVSSRRASYTNSKLKKGQTYYYKIRAYRKVGNKKVYGTFSVVRKVKAK